MKARLFAALLFAASTPVLFLSPSIAQDAADAQIRYITDRIHIPVRSGPSNKHRIVHWGLPSGTVVSLLSETVENDYLQIKTRGGTEGWVESQYLLKTPIARDQVKKYKAAMAKAKAKIESLEAQLKASNSANSSNSDKLSSLQSQNKKLAAELAEIKRISSNTVKINRDNNRLVEENQRQKEELDILKTDNAQLRASKNNDEFLNGAFAVLLGVIITLIVPRLWPKKKSEW